MSLTGMVYRPPYEANSLLLQVTQGCSHNKCTFCYMYPDIPFSVCPMEQVEADIDEATRYCPDVERVFLEHGDAFVLSADRLIQIADAIHAKLPRAKTIAMYASIQNIRHKTDADLRRLHECGIGGLDIGVESGLDAALQYMNKGHTAEEAREQLLRLTDAAYGRGSAGAASAPHRRGHRIQLQRDPRLWRCGALARKRRCHRRADQRGSAPPAVHRHAARRAWLQTVPGYEEGYIQGMHLRSTA